MSAVEVGRREHSRLLLVEDNPTNQEVATGLLLTLGYKNVTVVGDGLEALEALAAKDYDLVLMDCQLPRLDGYEATRRIRRPESPVRCHEVPVVAMTAHALEGDRATCLAAGMSDYITKPIQPAVLEQVLDRWLVSGSTEVEAEPSLAPPPETVFDRDDLLERLMGNAALADRVLARFTSDVPAQLAALSDALNRADHNATRSIAHSVKGAAANVGGSQLREMARQIEQLAKDGDLERVRHLLPDLNACWERFRQAIDSDSALRNSG